MSVIAAFCTLAKVFKIGCLVKNILCSLENFDIMQSPEFYRILPSLGTAYIHGLIHATGNFVIIMDADLSHHVSVEII